MKKKILALAGALILLTACSAQKNAITETQAQNAALKHAGFTVDQVSGLRCHRDFDDGRTEYDVEFYADGVEYSYSIHGNTGEILDFDTDGNAPSAPAASTTPEPAPETTTTESLTEEQAEAIALEHAGFTADQVSKFRMSYDIDDGVPVYEIEFYVDRTEYDYTIHAETGKILEWDIGD